MCPDCFDAVLFQVHLEDNSLKRWRLLEEGLEFEKDRLKKEEQFKKIILDIFMEYLKPKHIFGVYMQKQIT